MTDADFGCIHGDSRDCKHKEVKVDRYREKILNFASETNLLRIRILRQRPLWMFGQICATIIFCMIIFFTRNVQKLKAKPVDIVMDSELVPLDSSVILVNLIQGCP